jgi:hypothetical protein
MQTSANTHVMLSVEVIAVCDSYTANPTLNSRSEENTHVLANWIFIAEPLATSTYIYTSTYIHMYMYI